MISQIKYEGDHNLNQMAKYEGDHNLSQMIKYEGDHNLSQMNNSTNPDSQMMMAVPMQTINMSLPNINMTMPNINMPTPPATKGKRPLRHLTAADKIEAIQRIHDGESKASVARDIGVPESTLRGWCKNEEKLRYMSRQSQENAEKLNNEAMASGMGVDFLNGPPEKRLKFEQSFFKNGKMKYDRMGGMGGLDLSDKRADKGMPGLSGMSNYGGHSSLGGKSAKDMGLKGFGGPEMNKSGDPKGNLSMAAISPLTGLSHLSGMSGLGQGPLALSFNDIATNLNLLAQLNNPNLAAMSALSGMGGSPIQNKDMQQANRPLKTNPNHSPRSENDKSPSLTIKNLAKLQQKDVSGVASFMDKYKKSQGAMPVMDDALWYWLKTQQTMIGLNNLYSSLPRSSSPQAAHSPRQFNNPSTPMTKIPTPPIDSTPQETPPTSSTPDADVKPTSWFWQWYKNFGASFNEKPGTPTGRSKSAYENILYSQLTKDNINNNYENHSMTPKPEDLSHHQDKNSNENASVGPESPNNGSDENNTFDPRDTAKVKQELDNVLYNNNNNNDEKSEHSESDELIRSSAEALEHGEKFLQWLETCSDPSVTAMQVMQFRYMINSLKSNAERGNAGTPGNFIDEKPKVRRRK